MMAQTTRRVRQAIRVTLACAALTSPARSAPDWDAAWLARPTKAEIEAALPAKAREHGVRGHAVMRCQVDDGGALSGCGVIRESPKGMGFGDAIISLAGKYRRAPTQGDRREILAPVDWYDADTPPGWIYRPMPEDLAEVWPKLAPKLGVGGFALINCVLTVEGNLVECVTLDESPPGAGFGDAAVRLAPMLSMWPAKLKGAWTPSVVNIPVNFDASGYARR